MIELRRMQAADLEQVAAIEQEIFSVPWSLQAFSESLQNENTLFVVAENETEIIGYCGIYLMMEEGNITNVAIAPKHRRQGVAHQMVQFLLRQAQARGVADVFLEVRETNVAAICLYERLGFREAGIRKNYYKDPLEHALIMWKHQG